MGRELQRCLEDKVNTSLRTLTFTRTHTRERLIICTCTHTCSHGHTRYNSFGEHLVKKDKRKHEWDLVQITRTHACACTHTQPHILARHWRSRPTYTHARARNSVVVRNRFFDQENYAKFR